MSSVEGVVGELAAVLAGLDRAHAAAVAADRTVEQVAAQAALAGFIGVAVGVVRVREAIGTIRAQISAVGAIVGQATTPVAAAPKQMSPEQTAATLAAAADRVAAAARALSPVIDRTSEAQQLAATVLRGGQPGPVIAALGVVKEILEQVARRCAAAGDQLATVVAQARQLGDSKP